MNTRWTTTLLGVLALGAVGWGVMNYLPEKEAQEGPDGKNTVKIDGSSTVFPATEALTEEFLKKYPTVRATIGLSGTGGGFKKLSRREIHINNASRQIKASEAEAMEKNGIEYVEIPIAYDGISIVVNKENTWADYLSVDELHAIWRPSSTVQTWKDIRESWPDIRIRLYGPGTESGTFDYFNTAINGLAGASRHDFTRSEDDNILVQGISGDRGSLGYFGYAYYKENKEKIRALPIKNGAGPSVLPNIETIKEGIYTPLSRPLFLYVTKEALEIKEVRGYIEFYIENASSIVEDVGYIPMPEEEYEKLRQLIE